MLMFQFFQVFHTNMLNYKALLKTGINPYTQNIAIK